MKTENRFPVLENTLNELTMGWENVIITFRDGFRENYRNEKWADESIPTPKELIESYVKITNGIVVITVPENLDWAATVLACCMERKLVGLDNQLEIFKHNLNHPDAQIAFKTWHEFQKLSK